MMRSAAGYRFVPALVALLAVQLFFWYQTRGLRPELDVVPPPPGVAQVHALTLGDDEFYFRLLALRLQNFGDVFGRTTALKDYDFKRLSRWFHVLDTLDARSDMLPAMAAYYFCQTQHHEDIRYMVDYLYDHATRDVPRKWWWLLQAMYLASHRLGDQALALKTAEPMLNPEVPAWAQQMVAVVHAQRGEMEDALHIMETIKDNAKHITDADLRYMTYFIEERIKKLSNAPAPRSVLYGDPALKHP